MTSSETGKHGIGGKNLRTITSGRISQLFQTWRDCFRNFLTQSQTRSLFSLFSHQTFKVDYVDETEYSQSTQLTSYNTSEINSHRHDEGNEGKTATQARSIQWRGERYVHDCTKAQCCCSTSTGSGRESCDSSSRRASTARYSKVRRFGQRESPPSDSASDNHPRPQVRSYDACAGSDSPRPP